MPSNLNEKIFIMSRVCDVTGTVTLGTQTTGNYVATLGDQIVNDVIQVIDFNKIKKSHFVGFEKCIVLSCA